MAFFSNRKDTGRFLNDFLTKRSREIIGWSFIIAGLLLGSPPIGFPPDDFINIWLATYLVGYGIAIETAVVATYTIIPILIFLIGIYIFPAKDGHIAQKVRRKIIRGTKIYLKKLCEPKWFILNLISIYLIYTWYLNWLTQLQLI